MNARSYDEDSFDVGTGTLAAYTGMTMMATSPEMDALVAAVTASDSVVDSAVTFINGLAGMIAAAAGDRASSLALADDVKARADALAAAVAANTGTP